MKKHFLLTCLAFTYFGFGMAVQQFGIQAGMSLFWTIFIFITSMMFLFIIAFTSIQKLKDFIKENENIEDPKPRSLTKHL